MGLEGLYLSRLRVDCPPLRFRPGSSTNFRQRHLSAVWEITAAIVDNAVNEDLLGKSAMNQMLLIKSRPAFQRSVPLLAGDVPVSDGAMLSRSPTPCGVVGGVDEGMDGIRLDDFDLAATHMDALKGRRYAALRSDWRRRKLRQTSTRPSSRARPKTQRSCRRIDNLAQRSNHVQLRWRERAQDDPPQFWTRCGCPAFQFHKGRNILARPDERDWNGVSTSVLEGINKMPGATRLDLPCEPRCSLACTSIIEYVAGAVRSACGNFKTGACPQWPAAAMQEAVEGFRRLRAKEHLPALRTLLQTRQPPSNETLAQIPEAAKDSSATAASSISADRWTSQGSVVLPFQAVGLLQMTENLCLIMTKESCFARE